MRVGCADLWSTQEVGGGDGREAAGGEFEDGARFWGFMCGPSRFFNGSPFICATLLPCCREKYLEIVQKLNIRVTSAK